MRVFINDFLKRFKSDKPRINLDKFDAFHPYICEEENRELIKEVIEEEILTAFSQINNLKAPGPDRLQASFYQKYWKILGKSICKMAKAFFYNGCLLKEINRTFITLILKVDYLEASNHYHQSL